MGFADRCLNLLTEPLLGFHGAYLGTIRQACVPCIMYFVSDKLMSHCLLFAVYLVIPILCLLNR